MASSIHLLLELPKNVIQYMQEFIFSSWENRQNTISQKDEKNWRALMNINKRFFHSITRKESIFIQLNHKFTIEFLENEIFRGQILSLVFSPRDQIGLQFLGNKWRSFTEVMMQLPPYHYASIRSSPIKNLLPFQHIHHVEIHDCEHLQDISPLSQVHTLSLSDCLEIAELPELPNLHRLSLLNCHTIPLQQINKHNFPNLQELLIRDQRLTNPDLALFGFIHKRLSLHGPSITDISTLLLCEEVELSFCFNLREIPLNLSALTRLSLSHCHQVKSISHLSALQRLVLYSCHNIDSINFTQLHALEHLEIAYCPKISTLLLQTSRLSSQKLQSLRLSNNFQLKEISTFYPIAYCDINQCIVLNSITVDESCRIYFLTLKNQNRLPMITGKVNVIKQLK